MGDAIIATHVHLIAHADFEHGEHLRRQPRAEPVSAKSAERDPHDSRQRANQQERSMHPEAFITESTGYDQIKAG